MDSYNFLADLLDTYQSMPDVIKALWVVVPPAFVLGLVALLRRPEAPPAEAETPAIRYVETENGTRVALPPEREAGRLISPGHRRTHIAGRE